MYTLHTWNNILQLTLLNVACRGMPASFSSLILSAYGCTLLQLIFCVYTWLSTIFLFLKAVLVCFYHFIPHTSFSYLSFFSSFSSSVSSLSSSSSASSSRLHDYQPHGDLPVTRIMFCDNHVSQDPEWVWTCHMMVTWPRCFSYTGHSFGGF